jgi:N-acetylmuramoyl-L-alanine amidase
MITEEQTAALEQKRTEKRAKEAQDSPSEKREVVMHGATLKCKYAQGPGKLFVTSNELLLQDQKWATEGDGNNMVNLQFKGTCGHPKWPQRKMSPPPCMAVIKLSPWQNLGTNFLQEQKNLVKESYIECEPEFNTAQASPIPKAQSIREEAQKVASVTFAYFALIKGLDGNTVIYEQCKWAGVEDEIYVIVRTYGLVGKTIQLNVLDKDGVITTGNKYGILSCLQDESDKKGNFKTIVNSDGLAIFKLEMKPSKDEKAIKVWRDKIGATTDKIALLCLLVDAHTANPDFKITYMGKNSDAQVIKGDSNYTNYWQDKQGEWFELRRKNPVIVIDPGHGYTKGNTGAVSFIYTYNLQGADGKVLLDAKSNTQTAVANVEQLPQYVINDPVKWIVSKREDPNRSERFLVYDVCAKLQEKLKAKGYSHLFITRARGPIVGSDDSATRKARIDIANTNKADYFISVHADGLDDLTATGSHVIYGSTSDNDSKELATDIFSNYNVVTVESSSPKVDVRGLQVFSATNKTNRKVLVELGFVTSPNDAKKLFTNVDTIANQLADGLIINIKKSY